MNPHDLANLLEAAARELRKNASLPVPCEKKSRVSAREYAESIGVHEDTVQAWCRNAMLPEKERNSRLPQIKAFRRGKSWQIDVEKTEQAQALCHGTGLEKSEAKKSLTRAR